MTAAKRAEVQAVFCAAGAGTLEEQSLATTARNESAVTGTSGVSCPLPGACSRHFGDFDDDFVR